MACAAGTVNRASPRLPPLAEPLGRRCADPRRVSDHLDDTDAGLQPPLLRLLVARAFAHQEGGVQPLAAVVLREELDARQDRPMLAAGRVLLDALPVDGDEQVGSVGEGDHPPEVQGPNAVLAPPWEVRPSNRPR